MLFLHSLMWAYILHKPTTEAVFKLTPFFLSFVSKAFSYLTGLLESKQALASPVAPLYSSAKISRCRRKELKCSLCSYVNWISNWTMVATNTILSPWPIGMLLITLKARNNVYMIFIIRASQYPVDTFSI